MLKILHVIDSLGLGGAERHLCHIAEYLAARGAEQKAVQLFDGSALAPRLERLGIKVERLGKAQSLFSLPWLYLPLRRCAEAFDPQLISTQLPSSDVLGRLAAKSLNVPCLSTWQNTTYDPAVTQTKRARAWLGLAALLKLERLSLFPRARFVAVSRDVSASYRRALGVSPSLCAVIPNSVDLSRFPEGRRRPAVQGLKLIHVGRHVEQKGLDVLIRALSLLPQDLPVSVDFFGQGPQTSSLKRLAQSLGVAERTRFHGGVPDAAPYLLEADCFVLPSRHEGLSLAYLEALAAGLPVLASSIGPNREIDPAGSATLFFDPGDAEALAAAIERSARDPALREQLGSRARALTEPFRIERVGPKFYELCRSLLKQERSL